jgi:dimethylamine corrinoid protein
MAESQELAQALGELDEERVDAIVADLIASSPSPESVKEAVAACQEGMAIVGKRYEDGEYFIAELMVAGDLLSDAMGTLLPSGNGGGAAAGTMVVGTVKGDVHDIGKGIFTALARAAGYDVIDLGVDQPPEAFVAAVKESHPDVVGLSGLLTLALASMKETVDALAAAGVRDDVKVIIGGNAVTDLACNEIGADGYATSAPNGVSVCQAWRS